MGLSHGHHLFYLLLLLDTSIHKLLYLYICSPNYCLMKLDLVSIGYIVSQVFPALGLDYNFFETSIKLPTLFFFSAFKILFGLLFEFLLWYYMDNVPNSFFYAYIHMFAENCLHPLVFLMPNTFLIVTNSAVFYIDDILLQSSNWPLWQLEHNLEAE